MTTHDPSEALYVYGFTWAGAGSRPSATGVSGAADVRMQESGDIAAICSPVQVDEFLGTHGADAGQDLEWVAPRALRHEQVIEEVMQSAPVLPVTFGVLFSSPGALLESIRAHQQEITGFLRYVRDKEEWAVKAYASPPRIRAHLERTPEFRERLGHPPDAPGARYFHQRRLQRELDGRINEEAGRLAERVRDALAPLAVERRSLRLSSREVTGRQDDLVLHSAFLMPSSEVAPFTDRVRDLAAEYGPQGLTVEATGPWPPYAFSPSLEAQP